MGDVSTAEFEAAIQDYFSRVQSFVQTMHDGLATLTAPETVSNPATPAPRAEIRPSRLTVPKKILVVDELEVNRVLFGRYFRGSPLEITFARTKAEAEQISAREAFDLILEDWRDYLSRGLSKQDIVEQITARLLA